MSVDNPMTPGVSGPYAYPSSGVPVLGQGGQAAPAVPQTYQQAVAPSAQHLQPRPDVPAVPSPVVPAQHVPAQHVPAQHAPAQHAPAQHAGQPGQPSGIANAGTEPAASGAQAVSGSAPVRAPLRKDTGVSGTLEQGKGGFLAVLARLVGRGKPEADGAVTGSKQLKKNVGPRRVRAMLTTVDPWSIMKLAFLLSIAAGIMFVVATAIVWNVLNGMGVFDSVNEQIKTILGPESKVTFLQFTDRNKIMSAVILLSVINSILMTGLATIGAFLYNLIVKLVGGVYITLTDE